MKTQIGRITGIILTLLIVTFASATETLQQIPPAEDQARERLNSTPRHGEWVDIEVPGSSTKLRSWVVYPERKDKAPVVIVIQEIYGLTDWIRSVADQLAADGFIAIAPDLLSGKGPNGGGTESFADRDSVTKAVRALAADEVTSGLNAIAAYGKSLPSSNGKFATVGFCWGGSTSFRYATEQPELSAAVVYYGSSPEVGGENPKAPLPEKSDSISNAGYEKIKAPVLGNYGENDNRVNASIPTAEENMKKHNKSYTPKIYAGAGHGFLRQQSGQEGANKKASEEAWPATIAFLREHCK
jgi:carboxymethylenebutenolidase